MNKKNSLGFVFLSSFLAAVLAGMVYMQPEKPETQTVEYNMRGFPVLPASLHHP